MRHVKAFTLIELLVVISIIALLIAILLPSLSAARATATAVACQSNHRQIGILAATYEGDYNGLYPAGSIKTSNTASPTTLGHYDPDWADGEVKNDWMPMWSFQIMFGYLGQYSESKDVFACPRNEDILPVFSTGGVDNVYRGWFTGYSFNTNFHGVEGPMGWGIFGAPERLERPSAVYFVSENPRFEGYRNSWVPNGSNAPFAGMFARGLPGTGGRGSSLHGDISNIDYQVNVQGRGIAIDLVRERHPGNTVNTLHYDGHSQSQAIFELIDIYDTDSTWAANFFTGGTAMSTAARQLVGQHEDIDRVRVIDPH